eukprot:6255620-Prymnesium_polylepis.1
MPAERSRARSSIVSVSLEHATKMVPLSAKCLVKLDVSSQPFAPGSMTSTNAKSILLAYRTCAREKGRWCSCEGHAVRMEACWPAHAAQPAHMCDECGER